MENHLEIPVVDLFAGPGGLSEGFHRFQEWFESCVRFDIKLSIEKEPMAHRTLTLRAFFRRFRDATAPDSYYQYIQAATKAERARWLGELHRHPEWKHAQEEARLAELGSPELPTEELLDWVRNAVKGASDWVLLGGPPCQAYSVIGRARRTGVGSGRSKKERMQLRKQREREFFQLEMHNLYRQYLAILAVSQPAVFIMENVRGILSSRDPSSALRGEKELIFPKILEDVRNPTLALSTELGEEGFQQISSFRSTFPKTYDVYSFVVPGEITDNKDYLIKSEHYGIPQNRHRVILLGVRNDVALMPAVLPCPVGFTTTEDVIGGMPFKKAMPTKFEGDERAAKELVRREFGSTARRQIDADVWEIIEAALATDERLDPTTNSDSSLLRFLRDERLPQLIQHEPRSHMPSDLARYLFCAAFAQAKKRSPCLTDFPRALLPKHANVSALKKKGGKKPPFSDRFKVQLRDRPAATVTSHIAKDGHYYIHYDVNQNRSLTVREAARIQTFPDNYFFEGAQTDQFRQIGNAVPPYLAVHLANVVADLIARLNEKRAAA